MANVHGRCFLCQIVMLVASWLNGDSGKAVGVLTCVTQPVLMQMQKPSM